MFVLTSFNFLTIPLIPYFWYIDIHTSRHTYNIFLFFFPGFVGQFWNLKSYIETNVGDRQHKTVLVVVLLIVVKEILCTGNLLVSIFLQFMSYRTQLVVFGCQDCEQTCWVCLIFDLIEWILTCMSPHE